MRVAAHQPHSYPWLGYLHKIASCDLFVVMDDLQFEAQNFQNRNRVKVNNGTAWLTVPLARGAQTDRICDKRIANQENPKEHWQRRSWLTLTTHYGKSPHFGTYAKELEEVFARRWESLLEFDLHMMRLFMGWLGITTPVVLASSLGLAGEKTARIVDMCKKVGADAYFSGKGGSTGYLDLGEFERSGVTLEWQSFEHPVYPQRYPSLGFVKNLAALDLFLNCGTESRSRLFERTAQAKEQGGEADRGEALC
jgi:WbqC-like protein family